MEVLLRIEDGEYPLARGTYEIYRGPKNDISAVPVVLKGPGYESGRTIGANQAVSHKHLQINVLENSVELEDVGSRFGCRLDTRQFDKHIITGKGTHKLELGEVFDLELILK